MDRTVLIATHDDSIARQADEVMDMRDGRLAGGGGAPIQVSFLTSDTWHAGADE
jgi:ABC-type lipoprotein export system ATPase subunit